ncbi:MFS transporter [Bacillus sp. FJAT-47783]|uniref:MFS transporter n=1 Tax=Bacillus sp. FJAT-47783 TaxID=2922712 RepID=UPI001FAC1B5F|nr:MFS transporter [Bacillus sp. FJAT-47783]
MNDFTICWLFSSIYFLFLLASYGLNFLLPTIIKSLSTLFSNTQVGLIAMIPEIVGLIGLIWWARHSDQTGERWVHAACSLTVAAVGLIGSFFAPNTFLAITMISISFLGTFSFLGPFWALLSMFFTESSAAVAIALVNSIGGLGGFFGPVLLGYLSQSQGLLLFSTVFLLSLIPLFILKKNAFRQELDQSNIESVNKAT